MVWMALINSNFAPEAKQPLITPLRMPVLLVMDLDVWRSELSVFVFDFNMDVK
jgi:hypothetical protein